MNTKLMANPLAFLALTQTMDNKSPAIALSSAVVRVGYLDGWRGLAIALVLLHHFFAVEWANLGRLGVDLFFCLSGLLMSQLLFIKRVSLGLFYKRRISRILPSFLLYVFSIYGFAYFSHQPLGGFDFIATLLFLRSYLPIQLNLFNTGYPLGHIWSLNVEEHCYVLLSLLSVMPFLKNRLAIVLMAIGFLSIMIYLFYVFVPEMSPLVNWSRTETAMASLMLSAGYALIAEQMKPFIKSWMPLAAFLLGAFCYFSVCGWFYAAILSPFLLAFSVNHLGQTPQFFRFLLENKILRLLGISSYSIYLWQQPFYQYAQQYFYHQTDFSVLFLLLSLSFGFAMFYCFENPLRRYLNRIW